MKDFVEREFERGDVSNVVRKFQPIRISADREARFRAGPITLSSTLLVGRGPFRVSVAVVDSLSHEAAFARADASAR